MGNKCECGRDVKLHQHGVCYTCLCEKWELENGYMIQPSQYGPNRTRIAAPLAWKPKEATDGR